MGTNCIFHPKQVAALNTRHRPDDAAGVIKSALRVMTPGRLALVSSFGAESIVLLHLVAAENREIPVLFIDTGLLFAETLTYQEQVAERLDLNDIRVIRGDPATIRARDPYGGLRLGDSDACCKLRKRAPLEAALSGFDGWISGRKSFQSLTRRGLDHFELEEETGLLKVNPLAHWTAQDLRQYMYNHDLPPHPLVARGYPSIGCAPCTSQVNKGEDSRAGRWRGQGKTECGLHISPA